MEKLDCLMETLNLFLFWINLLCYCSIHVILFLSNAQLGQNICLLFVPYVVLFYHFCVTSRAPSMRKYDFDRLLSV